MEVVVGGGVGGGQRARLEVELEVECARVEVVVGGELEVECARVKMVVRLRKERVFAVCFGPSTNAWKYVYSVL